MYLFKLVSVVLSYFSSHYVFITLCFSKELMPVCYYIMYVSLLKRTTRTNVFEKYIQNVAVFQNGFISLHRSTSQT